VVRFNGATYEIIVAAVLGRIPYRAGHVSGGRFASRYDWLFNLPVTMGESDHEVDRYLALAERLGQVPSRRAPTLQLSSSDRAGAERVLDGFGLSQGRPVVALQPGTSRHQTWKRWPTAHWQALAQGLREAGLAVVALGSADERELLDQVCRDSGAFNAAGACSVSEAAAILERCQVLISTDSGLMHIADAVGTPVVGILGPTDWSRTRPYGKDHAVLTPAECRGHHTPCLNPMGELSPACTWGTCMQSIRPEAVLASALQRCQRIPC
jgi:lipopolysaccharide heptosyltransferase II